MLEFMLDRYNYWIVIILMMTGLYIVYARGNLVKKIVGLNVFQTSVFIFYITIGKIAGGTAPIYIGADLKKMKEGHHGDDHGDGHSDDHGEAHDASHGADADADHAGEQAVDAAAHTEAGLHSKVDNFAGNDLKDAVKNLKADTANDGAVHGLHDAPEAAEKFGNKLVEGVDKNAAFEIADKAKEGAHYAGEAAGYGDAAGYGEIIYTNPLPHVLILTAIVVGVAGTAVGLALAVRIREAYGTIEEDELKAMDDIAEFGASAQKEARA